LKDRIRPFPKPVEGTHNCGESVFHTLLGFGHGLESFVSASRHLLHLLALHYLGSQKGLILLLHVALDLKITASRRLVTLDRGFRQYRGLDVDPLTRI
jgi:hypothetical protein